MAQPSDRHLSSGELVETYLASLRHHMQESSREARLEDAILNYLQDNGPQTVADLRRNLPTHYLQLAEALGSLERRALVTLDERDDGVTVQLTSESHFVSR